MRSVIRFTDYEVSIVRVDDRLVVTAECISMGGVEVYRESFNMSKLIEDYVNPYNQIRFKAVEAISSHSLHRSPTVRVGHRVEFLCRHGFIYDAVITKLYPSGHLMDIRTSSGYEHDHFPTTDLIYKGGE